MATTTNTRRASANIPAVITVATWNAAQAALAQLQAEVAELRAMQADDAEFADDQDDAMILADDDDDADADEFADDQDDTTILADDADDNLAAGYYFNADDTSAVYIQDDGYGHAVVATGKDAGKIVNEPSDVDMDEHTDYAGDITHVEARTRLLAANEPVAQPTSRRRQAEVEAVATPVRKTVNDLTPDELRARITKAGGDPAKIVGGFHAKARTNAMQTWLKTFLKTKKDNGDDLAAAKRAATKAVTALTGRQMG